MDINNRYNNNKLETITASNIESWISNYIYSASDRFNTGISCGSIVTIQDGTYNADWVVVGADTELNKGDTKLTAPHLSLIPAGALGCESPMNDSATTAGGYAGSKMNKETIPKIVEALQKVLGDHLLARRVKLANSTDNNGKSNGSAYYTVYANLLCARQVFGKSTFQTTYESSSSYTVENSYDIGDDPTALPGFSKYMEKFYWPSIHSDQFADGFWLRSVGSTTTFAIASIISYWSGTELYNLNGASFNTANDTSHYRGQIRPLITIG